MASDTCLLCSDNFIVKTKFITCYLCQKKFHPTCANIKDLVSKTLIENKNLKWFCDECNGNVDEKIKSFDNSDNLNSHTSHMPVLGLQRENDLLKKIVSDQDYTIKLQKQMLHLNSMNQPNSSVTTSSASQPMRSYSQVIQTQAQPTEKAPVLYIKTKEKNDNTADIVKEIKSFIDPASSNINVNNTRVVRDGVIITCGDEESYKKLQNDLSEKVGHKYLIDEAHARNPRLNIQGIDAEDAETDNFISDLIRLNKLNVTEDDIKIITILKRTNASSVNVVIEVPPSLRSKIMETQTVYAGWRRCRVVDHVYIPQCHKCYGFHHTKKNCLEKMKCSKCAGEHKFSNCESNVEKCINCINHNRKYKTNFSVNHSAVSKTCHVYKRKIDSLIRTINYNNG